MTFERGWFIISRGYRFSCKITCCGIGQMQMQAGAINQYREPKLTYSDPTSFRLFSIHVHASRVHCCLLLFRWWAISVERRKLFLSSFIAGRDPREPTKQKKIPQFAAVLRRGRSYIVELLTQRLVALHFFSPLGWMFPQVFWSHKRGENLDRVPWTLIARRGHQVIQIQVCFVAVGRVSCCVLKVPPWFRLQQHGRDGSDAKMRARDGLPNDPGT